MKTNEQETQHLHPDDNDSDGQKQYRDKIRDMFPLVAEGDRLKVLLCMRDYRSLPERMSYLRGWLHKELRGLHGNRN